MPSAVGGLAASHQEDPYNGKCVIFFLLSLRQDARGMVAIFWSSAASHFFFWPFAAVWHTFVASGNFQPPHDDM